MAGKGGIGDDRRKRFEEEALPHLDALYSTAMRLARNPDDAHDLLQETALRAYRFFHQFEAGTNCRAWLLTILFNNFRNGYRRTAREQPASSAEDFEHRIELESIRGNHAESNPEALLAGYGMEQEVEAALAKLPDEFREALLLVDVEELSYQEISGVLNIPIGTVKSRVSRGRSMLREALAGYAKVRGIIRS
ncbi:MAG: sigma-70 family RNA polymerase sigma factor [Candidatus Binatus sp.]|uniref:sigma-70 family RNA polymerase sigma factor n=1 Tax=Candidatus Binatus sp. TaxID=2811406 RepID=UPI0027256584|nr:sigma-70 family RNA polymerase sigma factor [Candidatus Binatus sp.]MDO8434867.1 sigma-70 family RNA polymerase sigma factor [Candidatus Binatus sp.]